MYQGEAIKAHFVRITCSRVWTPAGIHLDGHSTADWCASLIKATCQNGLKCPRSRCRVIEPSMPSTASNSKYSGYDTAGKSYGFSLAGRPNGRETLRRQSRHRKLALPRRFVKLASIRVVPRETAHIWDSDRFLYGKDWDFMSIKRNGNIFIFMTKRRTSVFCRGLRCRDDDSGDSVFFETW